MENPQKTGEPTSVMVEQQTEVIKTEHAYRALFNTVKSNTNWKCPTKPFITKSAIMAAVMDEAIRVFLGGAEFKFGKSGEYIVTSKGYYHYMRA